MTTVSTLFRVCFKNADQVFEIYARSVTQGDLFGLLEVGQLVFGERSSIVLDPSEEKLKLEFAQVERFFIPVHSVVRIDVVTKAGPAKISSGGGESGKVMQFPTVPVGRN